MGTSWVAMFSPCPLEVLRCLSAPRTSSPSAPGEQAAVGGGRASEGRGEEEDCMRVSW